MKLNVIAAVDSNGLIAVDGQIPWKCPEDLKVFREKTMGHAVIMGRKTFESLEGPLPGRTNIVVTSQIAGGDGIWIADDLADAIRMARSSGAEEAFIIGGHNLFYEGMKIADTLHLTVVNADCINTKAANHTYFPSFALFMQGLEVLNTQGKGIDGIEASDHFRITADLQILRTVLPPL